MISYKTENGLDYENRLRNEFLYQIDPRLRAVLLELGDWIWFMWHKPLILTCLNRTEAENKAVGGSKYSAHKYCRGADIRSRIFEDEQKSLIISHIETVWNESAMIRPPFLYAIHHDSGQGEHFHINISWGYRMKNLPHKKMET